MIDMNNYPALSKVNVPADFRDFSIAELKQLGDVVEGLVIKRGGALVLNCGLVLEVSQVTGRVFKVFHFRRISFVGDIL